MGLHVTHDCWDGSCGGFRDFRELVGRAAGLPYRLITDPDRYDHGRYEADIDWDAYAHDNFFGEWFGRSPQWQRKGDIYGFPTQDDVLYLIVHSDVDGVLRLEYLPLLKARLEELEPRYDELAAGSMDEKALRRFIDGLGRAIEAGEHVEFD